RALEETAAIRIQAEGRQMHVDVRVAELQPPPCHGRIEDEALEPGGMPVDEILVEQGNDGLAGGGIEERCAELERGEPGVAIAKCRQVERELRDGTPAVAEIDGEHFLRVEVAIAEEHDDRVAGRVSGIDVDIPLETCRHPYRARDGAPHSLVGREIPRCAYARLHLEAAEVIVLELRAEGDAYRVRQGDLILDETAREIVAGVGGAQGEEALAVIVVILASEGEAPGERLQPAQRQMLDEIEVERAEIVPEGGVVAMRVVIVEAHRVIRVIA